MILLGVVSGIGVVGGEEWDGVLGIGEIRGGMAIKSFTAVS